jgi:DNA-binding response OmpR family regulator
MARILIIDDSELILQMLEMVCQQAGHETTTASSVDEARSAFERSPPDVVVTDLNLPGVSDSVGEIRSWGDVPVVIVSGRDQDELDEIAAERGAAGAVSKDAGLPGMTARLPDLLGRLV